MDVVRYLAQGAARAEEARRGVVAVCYTGNGPSSAAHARAITSLWMVAPELLNIADEVTRLRNLVALYRGAQESRAALVRRLDVALNGDNAAPQAVLCDLVAQVEDARRAGRLKIS